MCRVSVHSRPSEQPVCLCMYCPVAKLVHVLPEGQRVMGVATFKDKIYVLRWKGRDHVEVYDAISFALQKPPCIDVPNLRGYSDMALCRHKACLYIGDDVGECVHRVQLNGAKMTQWAVYDIPAGLSITAHHSVLVTCKIVGKIKEFSCDGELQRQLTLPHFINSPWHALQLPSSGELVVCHGDVDERSNRVCKLTSDGHHLVQSDGECRGSRATEYSSPRHVAVDNNEFLLVVDQNNRRVKLLSPTLDYIRDVVTRESVKWQPLAVCLDAEKRRMYVTDCKVTQDQFSSGRVLVFSI